MIVKCSALSPGLTLTGSFYDATTNPETLISAGQAFTEEGSTGVYKRDVGSTLDAYTVIRVLFNNNATAWFKPAVGLVEVVSDPAFLNLDVDIDSVEIAEAVLDSIGSDDRWIVRTRTPINGLMDITQGASYLGSRRKLFHSDLIPDMTGRVKEDFTLFIKNRKTGLMEASGLVADEIDIPNKKIWFAITSAQSWLLTPDHPHRYYLWGDYGDPDEDLVLVGRGPCDVGPGDYPTTTSTTTTTTTT